ncbi:hypothetical protein [Rhizobium sp. G21]|uniref:hypothetical protein n=1 Tax=Rhizobium sp. G21 TaxID=2758439 RepID=UPI001FEEDFF1|nr:hypothetical protein [Rhizobium sp. G21]
MITDFVRGADKMVIDGYSFALADKKINLVSGAAPVATNDKPVFLFENDNGRLWFDADGKGDFADPVLIATLQNITKLSAADFSIL